MEIDESTQNLESTINAVRLKPLHWRIWILSSMGIFIEGFNLFAIAVALPLIIHQYKPTPLLEGFVAASVIVGTVFGAAIMGRLADIWGRRRFYILNALIVTVFSLLAGLSTNLYALIVFQFCLGIGIGADYPICASYVSEFMPSRIRGRMLISAFSFQAVGMFTAALVGFIVLKIYPNVNAWHWMVAIGAAPAAVIFILRMTVPESPRWCIENGQKDNAIRTISKLSNKSIKAIARIVEKEQKKLIEIEKKVLPISSLFTKQYLRQTILASVPWFLMDVATYGIGIFTPTIIATVLSGQGSSFIAEDILSIEGAAIIDIFLLAGLVINILLVEKLGRIKLQLIGFLGMTIGLLTLAAASCLPKAGNSYLYLLLIGFIIYNFLMNMGPNATTFILPAELFPTKLRATAHGFSASFAKIGAVCGILFLPLLIDKAGLFVTMIIMSVIAFLGFVLTFIFKVETTGKSLEELSHLEAGRTMAHHKPKIKFNVE
jgi:MFS transporter, putative metabolite transport protein